MIEASACRVSIIKQQQQQLCKARGWGGHPIAHSVPGYYGQRVTRNSCSSVGWHRNGSLCTILKEKTRRAQRAAKILQWGLFTKWRRSGSAGHFCTRVHAGCMAGCVRPRKTHLRRATFCSFCLNTLRVILTDDLCVRRTWKIKPEKELEQDSSIFFFGSMTVSSVGLRTAYNTAEWLVVVQWHGLRLRVGGKRHLRLGFVFYTEKSSTPSVLAVLVLCLRSLAFVTVSTRPATSRLPDLANLLRYIMCTRAIDIGNCSWCSALHRSTINLDEKARKSSWRLKTHWDTCDCSATPSIEISSVFFRNTCVRLRSTVTGCRQTQVLRVLSDLYPIP